MQDRAPVPRTAPGAALKERGTARSIAGLLGFCLPLSGGLPLSQWLPGYPDQLTPIRLVTFSSLAWLTTSRRLLPLPKESRRMIQACLCLMAYGMLSLFWTPVVSHGLHDFVTVGMAFATGAAILLIVRSDGRALCAFAAGVLITGLLQVCIAL